MPHSKKQLLSMTIGSLFTDMGTIKTPPRSTFQPLSSKMRGLFAKAVIVSCLVPAVVFSTASTKPALAQGPGDLDRTLGLGSRTITPSTFYALAIPSFLLGA